MTVDVLLVGGPGHGEKFKIDSTLRQVFYAVVEETPIFETAPVMFAQNSMKSALYQVKRIEIPSGEWIFIAGFERMV